MFLFSTVGEPITIPKIEEPSQDVIDMYHAMYIRSLKSLFDNYKTRFGLNESDTLQIQWKAALRNNNCIKEHSGTSASQLKCLFRQGERNHCCFYSFNTVNSTGMYCTTWDAVNLACVSSAYCHWVALCNKYYSDCYTKYNLDLTAGGHVFLNIWQYIYK